ncbi:glycosyltransferase [Acidocella sp.]|uniref:glycosyltransferase n=1 Tax=Acidocella sp. TaxID=50710 RepID=UPI00262A02DB|nr:glycosyltransferase [Acidocella sp.]
MHVLIWHWGRRGAGPLFAANLAQAMAALPDTRVTLSLAAQAELLASADPPACAWREPTYTSLTGFMLQRLAGLLGKPPPTGRLDALRPDVALCAMPALLDGRMQNALMALHIPYGVVVHDAAAHPGDKLNFLALCQKRLLRKASFIVCLSTHVAGGLRAQGFGRHGQKLITLWHPPIRLSPHLPAAHRPGGPLRLLNFGRLLPYKGLDLLAEALTKLGPAPAFELRVCGEGPDSPALSRLRAMPHVRVEARWFKDAEVPALLEWADAVVLPYREASQSGVAALALAAGRPVLATKVGGLPEQLSKASAALLCQPNAEDISLGLQSLLHKLDEGTVYEGEFCADTEWNKFAKNLIPPLSIGKIF